MAYRLPPEHSRTRSFQKQVSIFVNFGAAQPCLANRVTSILRATSPDCDALHSTVLADVKSATREINGAKNALKSLVGAQT